MCPHPFCIVTTQWEDCYIYVCIGHCRKSHVLQKQRTSESPCTVINKVSGSANLPSSNFREMNTFPIESPVLNTVNFLLLCFFLTQTEVVVDDISGHPASSFKGELQAVPLSEIEDVMKHIEKSMCRQYVKKYFGGLGKIGPHQTLENRGGLMRGWHW